jgi:selenocysteine lyase/cysteine desulfurase
MDITGVRKLFPHLSSGRIYFNHASTAPVSTRHIEQADYFFKRRSSDKVDDYKDFLRINIETKNMLAEYLNTKPDRIGFTDNTSSGLNILAQGIKWKRGDKILLNDVEFPANVYPFLNLQREGVEIEFIKSENGIVSAENIIKNIKSETRLISISFVQFLSGYRIEFDALGKICKEKNIILSVDAIQGLGAFQLDVKKNNIDFISCGTQKWMLGMQGLAYFYISNELQEKLEPKYMGWLSVDNAWDFLSYQLNIKKSAEGLQTGTLNTLGIYLLNASLKLFKENGIDNVEKIILSNSIYFLDKLQNIGIKTFLSGNDEKNLSGIVSFKHSDSQKIFDYLIKERIDHSLRAGVIRFSPHFYNTIEEIDIVIEKLKRFIQK